jgi:hypothetical protein
MRKSTLILAAVFILSTVCTVYCMEAAKSSAKPQKGAGPRTGALIYGRPADSVGAYEGDGSERTGQYIDIDGGIGVPTGAYVGVKKPRRLTPDEKEKIEVQDYQRIPLKEPINSSNRTNKVRKYDEEGNLIQIEETDQ